jgi:hypothetical protein
MPRLLVIEKADEIRNSIEARFSAELVIDSVPSIEPAKEKLHRTTYDVIVWNACDESGGTPRIVRVLRKVAQKYPATKLFILSAAKQPWMPTEARDVTKQVNPKIAIPMHFWWEQAVQEYTQGLTRVKMMNAPVLKISKPELPQPTDIIVLPWGQR